MNRRPLVAAAVAAAAALTLLPYPLWITDVSSPLGVARSFAALSAALLLAVSRGRAMGGGDHTAAVGLFAAAGLLGALGGAWPWLWAVAAPLAVAGVLVGLGGGSALRRAALLLPLAALAFPAEALVGGSLDWGLQNATAHCSAPIVWLTGLDVHVADMGDPTLVSNNLLVHVTSLCAGFHTVVTITTLGLVIAEVFLNEPRTKLIFAALTPLFGFVGNVMRVVVSTHAARLWAHDGAAWGLAHDLIGYGAFLLTYAALFLLVRRWRRGTARLAGSEAA